MLKVSRSRNEIVTVTRKFSSNFGNCQKTNERIYFSILTTQKYLKLEFRFQVFPGRQDRKTNLCV